MPLDFSELSTLEFSDFLIHTEHFDVIDNKVKSHVVTQEGTINGFEDLFNEFGGSRERLNERYKR